MAPTDLTPSLKARELVLIVGGTLMVIGSFSPWTYEGLNGPGATFFRSGMQLGSDRSFSLAGLLSVVFGAFVIAGAATRLAEKRVFRIINIPPIVGGAVGVAVGLFGVGAANWYMHQMTDGYPALFRAGAGYGVWLVLGGGVAVLLASISTWITRRGWFGGVAAVVVVLAIGFTAFALAPK